jgi:hypothetical protein
MMKAATSVARVRNAILREKCETTESETGRGRDGTETGTEIQTASASIVGHTIESETMTMASVAGDAETGHEAEKGTLSDGNARRRAEKCQLKGPVLLDQS